MVEGSCWLGGFYVYLGEVLFTWEVIMSGNGSVYKKDNKFLVEFHVWGARKKGARRSLRNLLETALRHGDIISFEIVGDVEG